MLGYLYCCKYANMSWFVNFSASLSLQKIRKLLENTWYLYTAFDSATVKYTSCFDVHVQFMFDTIVHYFRKFCLTFNVSHTGELCSTFSMKR